MSSRSRSARVVHMDPDPNDNTHIFERNGQPVVFAIVGRFNSGFGAPGMKKEEIAELIVANGGAFNPHVSRNVDIVIAPNKNLETKDMEKARSNNIPIHDFNWLQSSIHQGHMLEEGETPSTSQESVSQLNSQEPTTSQESAAGAVGTSQETTGQSQESQGPLSEIDQIQLTLRNMMVDDLESVLDDLEHEQYDQLSGPVQNLQYLGIMLEDIHTGHSTDVHQIADQLHAYPDPDLYNRLVAQFPDLAQQPGTSQ